MTTLRPGLCYLKSVCRLSGTFVCSTLPTLRGLKLSAIAYFFAILYLSHPLTSVQNFTEIVPGEPLRRGVKRKKGSKRIERCHVRVSHLLMSFSLRYLRILLAQKLITGGRVDWSLTADKICLCENCCLVITEFITLCHSFEFTET